jgi:hypothetical protein
MIGYVTVGTNDLARAARFYDPIAEELGTSRMMEDDGYIAWAHRAAARAFARPSRMTATRLPSVTA